jgi:hypothetical protein
VGWYCTDQLLLWLIEEDGMVGLVEDVSSASNTYAHGRVLSFSRYPQSYRHLAVCFVAQSACCGDLVVGGGDDAAPLDERVHS